MKKPNNQDWSYQPKEHGFSSGFMWGVMLGVAGMFLFGTKKGRKIKRVLTEEGEKLIDELEEAYEETDSAEKLNKKIDKAKKKLKSKTQQAKEAAKDLTHISKLQQRGRKAARFFKRSGKSLKK